jgi:hypothetical protein
VPTAVHAPAGGHDTADNWLYFPAFGLVMTDQAVPFHDSASVFGCRNRPSEPTAMQLPADMQDTPLSRLYLAGLGLGVTD